MERSFQKLGIAVFLAVSGLGVGPCVSGTDGCVAGSSRVGKICITDQPTQIVTSPLGVTTSQTIPFSGIGFLRGGGPTFTGPNTKNPRAFTGSSYEQFNAVAVDGQTVVAAGFAVNGSGATVILIARYSLDGYLSTGAWYGGVLFSGVPYLQYHPQGFNGGKGYLLGPDVSYAGGLLATINTMKIDSRGNIVVAGTAYDAASNHRAFVARYTSDGAVDTTFGMDSGATYTNSSGVAVSIRTGVTLEPGPFVPAPLPPAAPGVFSNNYFGSFGGLTGCAGTPCNYNSYNSIDLDAADNIYVAGYVGTTAAPQTWAVVAKIDGAGPDPVTGLQINGDADGTYNVAFNSTGTPGYVVANFNGGAFEACQGVVLYPTRRTPLTLYQYSLGLPTSVTCAGYTNTAPNFLESIQIDARDTSQGAIAQWSTATLNATPTFSTLAGIQSQYNSIGVDAYGSFYVAGWQMSAFAFPFFSVGVPNLYSIRPTPSPSFEIPIHNALVTRFTTSGVQSGSYASGATAFETTDPVFQCTGFGGCTPTIQYMFPYDYLNAVAIVDAGSGPQALAGGYTTYTSGLNPVVSDGTFQNFGYFSRLSLLLRATPATTALDNTFYFPANANMGSNGSTGGYVTSTNLSTYGSRPGYGGGGIDSIKAMDVDPYSTNQNVYAAGYSYDPSGNRTAFIVRYQGIGTTAGQF